eukprot:Phypoly_transcript_08683.p1 GENE.Phypoly_transcript_08683~~Phypoly_transcript_08683.p1  ORF type:complete len:438 (-),score=104.42 Phypoly_transcript_08683:62-1375(-)
MAAATTSILDLIAAGLLAAGNKVMVRDVEGELTPQGTIISTTERGTIEYKTPTAFSKAVTNSTSGGWQQVKLKSSGASLLDVKRKFSGYKSRGPRHGRSSRGERERGERSHRERSDRGERGSTHHHRHHHHPTPVSHTDGDEGGHRVGVNSITLPLTVRFRDDDTKRGTITRISEDFSTFELEYKGNTYHSPSSASREMYREYAEETGEVVSINSNGFEDLKYQTPAGDWCKLRDIFPSETRKRARRDSSANMDEDNDEEMEDDEDPPTPPLTPPSPTSSSTPPPSQRTMIAKHIKHSLLPSSEPTSPPHTTFHSAKAGAPIVLSLKSPPVGSHGKRERAVKDIELLVHVESVDSIPYEVTGTADSYDALRNRIAHVVPDFPFSQPHELGVYSEYWEKHAGVAYVKPPRSWADFPACTTLLLKKIPETIIINNSFDL